MPALLQAHGWTIIPVNPFADELFGERVHRTLAEVPVHVDLVDVFRPAAEAPEVARQAAAIGAGAVWLQQDIISAEARRIAAQAGMEYVEDRCIAVERALHRVEAPAPGCLRRIAADPDRRGPMRKERVTRPDSRGG